MFITVEREIMNHIFEKTKIWQLLSVYLLANVLNGLLVIPIRYQFNISQDLTDELMRGLMFGVVFLWFTVLMMKNKQGIGWEFKNLRKAICIKECGGILIFNYSLSLTIGFVLLMGISIILEPSIESTIDTGGYERVISYASVLLNFVITSFLVPIVEEFMFRGVLLTRFQKKMNSKSAVMLSSVLFGITHLTLASLGATVFGICMCVVYLRTKNIMVPIVMHVVHNLILGIIGIIGVGSLGNIEVTTAMAATGTGLFAIIALVSSTYLIRKYKFFCFKSIEVKEGL